MIRAEFRKILMDQRGAAVILWSFFVISIPIYIVIARSILGNPDVGSNPAIAEPARVIFWLLTLIDLGYYAYWKKRNMSAQAILRSGKATKLFRALEEFQGHEEERAAYLISTYVTRKVVVFAIIEAIAVYGFVLAFLGRYVSDQYLLSTISLMLLVVEFPSAKSLESLLEAVEHSPSETMP
ncbi:MAG TPA: hypothetical protein VJQ55_18305 [Candidatus Binatia bacterium]|nr:hypothetical protein [Candidatus Binatia bacterium]